MWVEAGDAVNILQGTGCPDGTESTRPQVSLDQRREEIANSSPERQGVAQGTLEGTRTSWLSHPDPMLYYLGFIPVIDGDFIPDDPINLYANAADIDYLAGINNMDGHLFASIDMPAINKNNKEVTE